MTQELLGAAKEWPRSETDFTKAQLLLRNSASKKVTGFFDLGPTTVASVSDSASGSKTNEAASFTAASLSLQFLNSSTTGSFTSPPTWNISNKK